MTGYFTELIRNTRFLSNWTACGADEASFYVLSEIGRDWVVILSKIDS